MVTAEKREQSSQDVPLAVSALSATTLTDAGVVSMQGVAMLVPSFEYVTNNSPINSAYRIRGVGSDTNIPTFEPDVGLFIDGVYMERTGLGLDELEDIERVEVLKGPQSTLYGKNTTAGVVNIITKAPTESFEASLDATLSNLDGGVTALAYRLSGMLSGPLTEGARGRLSAVWYDQDPTFKNLDVGYSNANAMKRYALRGLLDVDLPHEALLRLSFARAEMPETQTMNPDLYYGPVALNLDTQLGPLFHVAPSPCPDNDPANRIICSNGPETTSAYTNIAAATFTVPQGDNTFTSITGWTNYHSEHLEPDASQVQTPVVSLYKNEQKGSEFTQEFRIASPTGHKFEWLGGLYYLHTILEWGDLGRTPTFILGPAAPYIPLDPGLPANIVIGQNGDIGYQNSQAYSDYAAVFGQAAWHLTDQFALIGGLRWQDERKHSSVGATYRVAPNPAYIGTPYEYLNLITAVLSSPVGNGTYRHASEYWPYSLTAQYKASNTAMLYATYSHSSKAGGTNIGYGNAPPQDRPFADETVSNYEAGAKLTLAEERVRLDFAAFHTVYDQYQNAGFVALQFLVDNAEKVIVNGAEADGVFALAKGLMLSAGATYLKAKYDTYLGGSCYYGLAPNSLPNSAGVDTACNLSGSSLPFAPRWRLSTALQYEHSAPFGTLYGRVDWLWSSEYHTNTNLDPRNIQSDYSAVNLRLGSRLNKGLDISIFALNFLNKTVVLQAAVANLITDGSYQQYLANPRELGLGIAKKF